MKAFLLAAGQGTRLRPITKTVPKCLIPVAGKPLLKIWLENLEQSGITEVLINLHWKADMVRSYLRDLRTGIQIRCVEELRLLGSAGTVAANRFWIEQEQMFWIIYGDVLTKADLKKMRAFHLERQAQFTMGLVPTDQPHRCGIAQLNGPGTVVSFEEKPLHPRGNLAFSGIFLANPRICDFIPRTSVADLGRDVFPKLVGLMQGYIIREFLLDIGTIENYRLAQKLWDDVPSVSAGRPAGA